MSVSDLLTVLSAPTAVLCEPSGQIRREGAQGVQHADRRYLAEAVLEVGGAEPTPLAHALTGSAGVLFTYTVPSVPFGTVTRQRGTGATRPGSRGS